ncbi:MAG: LTA synthase family protein [Ruminococcaceae bacterium]|nr:LTA synthase family protein [Oscillospiraceae bacterium]
MKAIFKKRMLDFKGSLSGILIMSLFFSLFQILIHIGNSGVTSFLDAFNPINLIINISIFYLITSLLFFITGKLHISFVITGLTETLLLVVNYYRLYFLSVPLKASDFILGKEATSILDNYTIPLSIKVTVFVLLFITASVFVCMKVKNKAPKLWIRALGVIVTLSLSFGAYVFIYSDSRIYEKTTFVTNEFSEIDMANGHGFIYSLINGIERTRFKKPEGYSREEVKKILTPYSPEGNIPNVIAVMGEAFFDIREAKNLKFEKNPLPNYTRLKKEGIYGDMIVPGFAGNTSSTEFEFLTGVNISLIDKGMPVPYKTFLNKKAYGLPHVFSSAGFETVAMHPGHNWFYNRLMAYSCMGFSRSVFLSDLGYKTKMTNYYTDDSEAAKMIMDDYSRHLEKNPDKGYFNFTVTIQNHGPYMNYDTGKERIVKRTDEMDDNCYYTLENYVQGLKDADNFLKTLKDYIEEIDRPTVIIYFGDHLPFLDSELKYYDLIGYDITEETDTALFRKHKTPYLIFSNQAFKNDCIKNGKRVLRGQRNTISSSYLATELFSYMRVDMPPYFEFLNSLKTKVNVFSPKYFMSRGQFFKECPEEFSEEINTLKNLQYYSMMEYNK